MIIPSQIQLSQAMVRALGQNSQAHAAQIQKTLAVGRLLNVTARRNPKSGKLGIYLLGQPVDAELPSQVKENGTYRVRVEENGETLVLKLVENTSNEGSEFSLPEALRSLLSQNEMSQLQSLRSGPPTPFFTTNPASPEGREFQRTIASFESQSRIIRLGEHADHREVARVLAQLTIERAAHETRRATHAVRALSQERAHPPQSRESASLIQMVAAQEVLSYLNPVLLSSGEPTLTVAPAIIGNEVTTCTVSVSGRPQGEIAATQTGESPRSEFRTLELSISLRGIGKIQAWIAHRDREVLIRFILGDEILRDRLHSAAAALKKRLEQLGWQDPKFSFVVGSPETPMPDWFLEATTWEMMA